MSVDFSESMLTQIEKIIRQHSEGISEYELLKEIETILHWSKGLSSDVNLMIFQKHFLLMNALYRIQEKIDIQSKESLYISPLQIQIREHRHHEVGQCLDNNYSQAKLKEYYLDVSHFENASEKSVDELLAQFWLKFHNTEKKDTALLLLELTPNSSDKEIKEQYKKLAHQHHPDKGGDAERFVEIQAAWEILKP